MRLYVPGDRGVERDLGATLEQGVELTETRGTRYTMLTLPPLP